MNFEALDNFENRLLKKGAQYLDQGRHRRGFRHKNVVYKIPRGSDGVEANRLELNMYKRYGRKPMDTGALLARCRMLKNGVLVMEYLQPAPHRRGSGVPMWARGWDWNEHGAQIGLDRKGNLRIFDYAE